MASKKGYDQILWLRDGLVTEVGQMNLFCLWKTKEGKMQIITAPLDGTILPGIVRKSVLELAREWNDFEVVEDYYSISDLGKAVDEGRVIEIFGTGTGAVVCPVAGFEWNDKYYSIAPKNQPLKTDFSRKVLTALEKIHYGEIAHPWAVEVPINRE
jgi:branched-chain amino acid aminotransferase